MTCDKQRAAIIEAMADEYRREFEKIWRGSRPARPEAIQLMTVAFDAQHGLACVVPFEATEEMIDSTFVEVGKDEYKHILAVIEQKRREMWRAMSAAGDLTNPPGKAK